MSQTPTNEPIPSQRGDEPPGGAGNAAQPGPLTPPHEISAEDFAARYDEPLEHTLNLDTWEPGENLDRMFARLDQEISAAPCATGVTARPRWNQWRAGISPFAIAMKLASRASEARRS